MEVEIKQTMVILNVKGFVEVRMGWGFAISRYMAHDKCFSFFAWKDRGPSLFGDSSLLD